MLLGRCGTSEFIVEFAIVEFESNEDRLIKIERRTQYVTYTDTQRNVQHSCTHTQGSREWWRRGETWWHKSRVSGCTSNFGILCFTKILLHRF